MKSIFLLITLTLIAISKALINEIPPLGFGTWRLLDNNANASEIVANAIENGFRHIDCALVYQNQKEVGIGIQEGLKRTGLKRSDLWITSKLWNNRHGMADYAIKETLNQLQLDYLDLFLVHWPMGNSTGATAYDFTTAWKQMEELVRPTLGTRFIGISNFNPSQLDELLKTAKIKPKVHQFEAHPYLPQSDYVKRNQDLGISVTGYAPLGNTNPAYAQIGRKAPPLLANPVVNEIASSRKCTPAQVVLAWNIKRGVGVIPKASNTAHQKENFATLKDCSLTEEDLKKIASIGVVLRVNSRPCSSMNFTCFDGMTGGPYP